MADGHVREVIEPVLLELDETIKRFEACVVPGVDLVYVVIYDWDPYWWGSWAVVGVDDGTVAWQAGIEGPDGGPPGDGYRDNSYIVSARALKVEGYPNPLIEVFDSSHMGNGSFNLFELKGRRLIHLFSTRAYDAHGDTVFRGGKLNATYIDLNADGAVDIVLSGIVDFYASFDSRMDGVGAERSEYHQARFIWTPAGGRFVEDSP